jgi:hypothetical protein
MVYMVQPGLSMRCVVLMSIPSKPTRLIVYVSQDMAVMWLHYLFYVC